MSRPLWEEIDAASWARMKAGPYSPQDIRAAEFRALANIIEQRRNQGLDWDPGQTADWLRAEAERAEGRS